MLQEPSSAVVRHGRHSSNMKPLRIVLWMIWIATLAVLWVVLLDTSFDWISSSSDTKVLLGLVILISMVGVAIVLIVKGARTLWTR